jgi:predicted metal-dependent hydrolase
MSIVLHSEYLQAGRHHIPYKLVKGKPRSTRLHFNEEAVLLIETSNGRVSPFDMDFLREREQWLVSVYHEHLELYQKKQKVLGHIERQMLILGQETPVQYVESAETSFRFKKGEYFIVHAPREYITQRKKQLLFYSLRKYAEAYLERRTRHWMEVCNLTINKLRIKDLRSKWGSCSSLRNINLNWHLILLDEKLIDYIIVHELMHLHEMNHSKRFWAWVAKYIPDYKREVERLNERQWLVGILS